MSHEGTSEGFRGERLKEIDEVVEAYGGWPLVGSVEEETAR
jgi:hypothetical protein